MPGKVRTDSNGNSLVSDATRLASQAVQFIRYCRRWSETTGQEYHIRSIALYPPSQSRNGMWLVIAKSWYGGYKLVAFHRSPDPLTALVGFFQKWVEDKLDWKQDKFADD
jgi:hypothetical protein